MLSWVLILLLFWVLSRWSASLLKHRRRIAQIGPKESFTGSLNPAFFLRRTIDIVTIMCLILSRWTAVLWDMAPIISDIHDWTFSLHRPFLLELICYKRWCNHRNHSQKCLLPCLSRCPRFLKSHSKPLTDVFRHLWKHRFSQKQVFVSLSHPTKALCLLLGLFCCWWTARIVLAGQVCWLDRFSFLREVADRQTDRSIPWAEFQGWWSVRPCWRTDCTSYTVSHEDQAHKMPTLSEVCTVTC